MLKDLWLFNVISAEFGIVQIVFVPENDIILKRHKLIHSVIVFVQNVIQTF